MAKKNGLKKTGRTKRPPAAKRKFLIFEDGGGEQRSSFNPIGDVLWFDSLKSGRRAKKPAKAPRLKIAPPLPRVEDMPWCGTAYVVSKRLRQFLETEAPGHAQFFEAEVTGPKKLIQTLDPALPYYIVNWLHIVDCIDLKKSEYDVDEEPGEDPDYTFYRMALNPAKVPRNVHIFRLERDCTTTVIDSRLAEKIKKAGFIGPQFHKVEGIIDAMGL